MASERSRFIRSRVLPEVGLIGVSLILGLLIWLVASNQVFETEKVNALVQFLHVPDNVEIQAPEEVELSVSMPANLRDLIRPGDFEAQIDLSSISRRAGFEQWNETQIPLDPRQDIVTTRDLGASQRVITPESIRPRILSVQARLITAAFNIEPLLRGEPAAGHHVQGEPEIRPIRIWLTASRAALDEAINSGMVLQTDPIDLSGLRAERHTFSPNVQIPEGFAIAGYQETESSPIRESLGGQLPERLVVVNVVEDTIEGRIEGCGGPLPILRRDLVLTQQLPQTFDVVVSGPVSLVQSLTPANFEVTSPALLDIDRPVAETRVQVQVRLRSTLPDEVRQAVRIVTIEPSEAIVTIEAVPTQSTEETIGTLFPTIENTPVTASTPSSP